MLLKFDLVEKRKLRKKIGNKTTFFTFGDFTTRFFYFYLKSAAEKLLVMNNKKLFFTNNFS